MEPTKGLTVNCAQCARWDGKNDHNVGTCTSRLMPVAIDLTKQHDCPDFVARGQAKIEPQDPWSHRATRMTCMTCIWYVQKCGGGANAKPIGRCRRHAPTLGGYPAVYPKDWCGDHKVDENKVTV